MSLPASLGSNGRSPAISSPPVVGQAVSAGSKRRDRFHLQTIAAKLLPTDGVRHCLRTPTNKNAGVLINKHETGSCSLGSVQTCKSVWHCPCCASRISEVRRGEVETAIAFYISQGYSVAMVTHTIPHGVGDDFKGLLNMLSDARKRMTGYRNYKKLKQDLGVDGTIRSLEVTHGKQNGFHPHIHELWFYKGKGGKDSHGTKRWTPEIDASLFMMWRKACLAAGLSAPSLRHGIKVDHYDPASSKLGEYVTKWGMDCEMTKSSYKKGRNGSRSPWEILRDAEKIESDRALFRAYAHGMKGQRQLFWSRGLKKLLLVADITDKEIMEDGENVTETFEIEPQFWWLVLLYGNRSDLLRAAEKEGMKGINKYLYAIMLRRDIRCVDDLPERLPKLQRLAKAC